MQSILDAINEWIKEILIGAINGNLSTMFGDVNEKVGTIANEVGQTPQGWNANIFSMIQTLSENVIVPIAGLVITYVLCYELISMVTEKNNMHDIETFMFFKWIFKAFVAVFIVTNTFNITMAVFDMAQHIVSGAAGVIGGDTNIDVPLKIGLLLRNTYLKRIYKKWGADSHLLAVCAPFFLHYRGNVPNNAIIPDAIKLPLAPTAKSLRIRKDFFTIPTSSLLSTALIVSSIIVFTFSEFSLKVV